MTMPWLASASPTKFFHKSQSPNAQSKKPNSSGLPNSITHEIQQVRSALESRFHSKPKTPTLKSPFFESQQDISFSRNQKVYKQLPPHPRHHLHHPHHPHHGGHRQYPSAQTADPRLCQFPPSPRREQPREKMYYSISERKVINLDDPSPRYQAKSPPSGRRHRHEPRTPKSSSPPQWPNEKTPISPYHPRHRGPPSGGKGPPVPHTAYPLGAFPRYDGSARSRSPKDGQSLSAAPESREGKRFGLFDLGKVKFALPSPHSASKTQKSSAQSIPTPIPTPNPFRPRDSRRHGFYQHHTPYTADFHSSPYRGTPKSAGVVFDEEQDYPGPLFDLEQPKPRSSAPRDEKSGWETGSTEKEKGSSNVFNNFRKKAQSWARNPFQRPKSRVPSVQPDAEPQTLEEIEKTYQPSAVHAWTTIGGAWLIQFTTFGYIWSWAVFQDYYMNSHPTVHTVGRLAWIGSVQLALAFALGIVSGKLLDAGYFRHLTLLGSGMFGIAIFILSFIDPSKFGHLFLVQGLLMGCGLGLVFLPTALIGMLHFKEKKAMITGIVMSGSAFGAMVYPMMLDKLLGNGFKSAVRGSSYMVIALLVIGNCLVARPPKEWSPKFPHIDLVSYLKERHYALICGGIFLTTFALWFPQNYTEEFAVQHGVNPTVSFYSVAIIGIAGVMGRIVMGVAADKVGPWNLLIPTTFFLFALICAMASLKSVAALVVLSLFYGFASGAWLSLLISALASLASRNKEIGHRVGLALSLGSLGVLFSGPAQAGLVSVHWTWPRAIGLFAFFSATSIGIFIYVRILVSAKRRFKWV